MASVALGTHYEKFIKEQLESGRYNNASEVVRAGLRMLEDFETARERWMREEIPSRLAEMRNSPSVGIPADEIFAEIDALHARRTAKAR